MRQPAQPSSSELVLLGQVIRGVIRRARLSPADAGNFSRSVQLKFFDSGYEAFARFDGRSSLRTYLITVVCRLLREWRNAAGGRRRPSAAARRLGMEAGRLDRLINRDGSSVEEAIEVTSRPPAASPDGVLRRIADRLPRQRSAAKDSDPGARRLYRTFGRRAGKLRRDIRGSGAAGQTFPC